MLIEFLEPTTGIEIPDSNHTPIQLEIWDLMVDARIEAGDIGLVLQDTGLFYHVLIGKSIVEVSKNVEVKYLDSEQA